jgi:hypothetical protein
MTTGPRRLGPSPEADIEVENRPTRPDLVVSATIPPVTMAAAPRSGAKARMQGVYNTDV